MREANVGTMVLQWGVVLAVLLLLNRWLARRTGANIAAREGESAGG